MQGDDDVVVVPSRPGPLGRPRSRDELDELIENLFPDTDEGPGWFDVALLVVGGALMTWRLAGSGPVWAVVVGALLVALGCILPMRAVWRVVERRRRRGEGVPLRLSHPATRPLAAAYDRLAGEDPALLGAAHIAVMEVATLLRGRPPGPAEREYVEARAEGIEGVLAALAQPVAEDVTLVEARQEVEALAGSDSLARLDELASEVRARRGRA